MKQKLFHTRAKSFLNSIIRQRKYLIKHGLSAKNNQLMIDSIQHLTKYIEAYSFDSDIRMAKFWLSSISKISCLLPGVNSNSYASQIDKFESLTSEARAILTPTYYISL